MGSKTAYTATQASPFVQHECCKRDYSTLRTASKINLIGLPVEKLSLSLDHFRDNADRVADLLLAEECSILADWQRASRLLASLQIVPTSRDLSVQRSYGTLWCRR